MCKYCTYKLHVLLHSAWLSVFLLEVWKSIFDEFRSSGCYWLAAGLALILGICQVDQTSRASGAHLLSHLDEVLMNPAKLTGIQTRATYPMDLVTPSGKLEEICSFLTIKWHCLQMFWAAMIEAFTAHQRLEIFSRETFGESQWKKSLHE